MRFDVGHHLSLILTSLDSFFFLFLVGEVVEGRRGIFFFLLVVVVVIIIYIYVPHGPFVDSTCIKRREAFNRNLMCNGAEGGKGEKKSGSIY
eukprot:gene4687-3380_t